MRHASCLVVVLAVLAADLDALGNTFSISDCSSNRDTSLVKVSDVKISPHPIRIPGNLQFSGKVKLRGQLGGDLQLEVSMKRSTFLGWFPIPCIHNIGSCSYPGFCNMLPRILSLVAIKGPANGPRPLKCPLPPGDYVLHNTIVSIPELSGALSAFAKGDYRVIARLKDSNTGKELGCQQVELSISG